MSAAARGQIDLVYTWVDDTWPGYAELLRSHAGKSHDLNPNRTRDNLETLRYSLRSVAAYAPWIGNVHLFTCRPQVPRWLDTGHPRLRVHHHDEVMDAGVAPTFNSFAIISYLHRLPGISESFIYMEDDMLLGAPLERSHLVDADGRIRVFPRRKFTVDASHRADAGSSPWNASLANANFLLDARYGPSRRRAVNHVPLWIERALWQAMIETWPDVIRHTRASRFRSVGNVPPEYLYPHFILGEGRARAVPVAQTYRETTYFPLENFPGHARVMGLLARWRKTHFVTFNDNFGAHPRAAVVAYVRALLERWWPSPSPFERAA